MPLPGTVFRRNDAPVPLILTIEKIVHGGNGLARTPDGRIVFVSGVLPGERVAAVPAGKRYGTDFVDVKELVEPSPDRRTPPCPHFGVCGGCDWLFIDYARQPMLKKEIFLEAMRRIGKISHFPEPEIIGSPEFGYRRRAQLKIDAERSIGFFKRESNDVVAVTRCPLLTDRLNGLLERCRTSPAIMPDGVRNLRVIDGDVAVASEPYLAGITSPTTTITCRGVAFEVGGADFFQGNCHLLEPMIDWVALHCGNGCAVLADLYGGTGFFSLTLARLFETVVLVESESAMVGRAKENAHCNNITNLRAISAPAETMERSLPTRPGVMIVDPPRSGLTHAARDAVVRMAPELLVYVSCNCATQARDCGHFVNTVGYTIEAAALFDLYPNTHHTETIVVLRKPLCRPGSTRRSGKYVMFPAADR